MVDGHTSAGQVLQVLGVVLVAEDMSRAADLEGGADAVGADELLRVAEARHQQHLVQVPLEGVVGSQPGQHHTGRVGEDDADGLAVELLAQAATAWRPELRATDTIARYGGEEFSVLLPHSDIDGARSVVERLLAVVPLGQTTSAGIALWDGTETAAQLLARADAALYDAKNAGRARALIAA